MPRNVEIKARVKDLARICELAAKLSGQSGSEIRQHDVFYNSPNGRLKMRSLTQDGQSRTELIWYDRPDVEGPKLSDFKKFDLPADMVQPTQDILRLSMDVKGDVEKVRTLFLYEQTRIHIDHVKGLGDFMELEFTHRITQIIIYNINRVDEAMKRNEVCLRDDQSLEEGQSIAEEIQKALEVPAEDRLTGAYMDMLLQKA